jgi:hypothetical protein
MTELKKFNELYRLPPPSSPPPPPLESPVATGRVAAAAATRQHSTLPPLRSVAAAVTRQHSTPPPCRRVAAPFAAPQQAFAFHSLPPIMYANKTNGSYVRPPSGKRVIEGKHPSQGGNPYPGGTTPDSYLHVGEWRGPEGFLIDAVTSPKKIPLSQHVRALDSSISGRREVVRLPLPNRQRATVSAASSAAVVAASTATAASAATTLSSVDDYLSVVESPGAGTVVLVV